MIPSYVVSLYGLDGKREHWVPGNRKRGLPAREKRGFATEAEARERMAQVNPDGTVYVCSICGQWHMASPKRRV